MIENYVIQGGAFGLVVYMIYWFTQKMDRKMDENTNVIRANTAVMRDLHSTIKESLK